MLRALLASGIVAAACVMVTPGVAADAPMPAAPDSAIPFKKAEREPSSEWVQAFGALVLVGALAWAAVYALKRSRLAPGALRGARRIRLVEMARLDTRVTLYLVEGEDRSYLLGRCGDSLVVIRDFEGRPGASSEART